MSPESKFKALIVPEFGKPAELRDILLEELPSDGFDVLIKVSFSSLNYKDGLAITSKGKVLRTFPCVPGIDMAGTIEKSESEKFKPGDEVLVTGCGIGESSWGGYSQYARVKSDWIVPLPKTLTLKRAMAIGTAGFTSMMAVIALEERRVAPESGDILVTGASGGVGGLAIAILAKLGYRVVASTGRLEETGYLNALGASEVIDRNTLTMPTKPLEKARWAGAIDSVGGETLSRILSETKLWGAVASCGLAGGAELKTTVVPFILRGISLVGIHSVETPMDRRLEAWRRIGTDLPLDKLDSVTRVESMTDLPRLADEILLGKVRGRTVIDVGHA